MKFQMKSTAKAVALGIVTLAASAAFATQTPVEFDLKGHDEFVKSLGKDAIAPQQRTAEESKAILAKVYNEKLEQHVSSFHYEKGVPASPATTSRSRAARTGWFPSPILR